MHPERALPLGTTGSIAIHLAIFKCPDFGTRVVSIGGQLWGVFSCQPGLGKFDDFFLTGIQYVTSPSKKLARTKHKVRQTSRMKNED